MDIWFSPKHTTKKEVTAVKMVVNIALMGLRRNKRVIA